MTYVKVDVSKPTSLSPGKGGNKKTIITIVDIDDLSAEAPRDSKGVLVVGKHQFKENAYAVKLYGTIDSLAGSSNSEGDIDAEGWIQQFVLAHPGSEKEIREFRANWLNRNIMIFVEKCAEGSIDQYGASCAPLRLQVAATDDKDKNNSVFTFKSANKGPDVGIYQDTLTLASPVDTVDADATSIDLAAGEGEYQLTDNSAEAIITTATNAVDGMVFTLLGSGGSFPSDIDTGNDFELKDGSSWSAIAGAKITFKAFKNGPATWKFIEISRY